MNIQLLNGDCLDKLKELSENSIDSIVTDPPYGLSFMGKKWDYDVPSTEIWEECMRVLKPGGHLLSFAGSRTYHRMAVRIEDAGFEIRDQIMWIYGSGFPKSHNIGHKIDEYKGWGTALKPSHEPIVMARKPFSGTVANNVLEWGTGGINIDECRVGNESRTIPVHSDDIKEDTTLFGLHPTIQHHREETTQGRFPANIILDEEAGKILDEQSGKLNKQGKCKTDNKSGWQNEYVGGNEVNPVERKLYLDEGGASRFFYCPKASKKDRNEGCDNIHPTVKPTDLMKYLIRLVTPKGGVVLDPFMGSGSTGKAAVLEGMNFVGIEREKEYYDIAKTRIEHSNKSNKHKEFFE